MNLVTVGQAGMHCGDFLFGGEGGGFRVLVLTGGAGSVNDL